MPNNIQCVNNTVQHIIYLYYSANVVGAVAFCLYAGQRGGILLENKELKPSEAGQCPHYGPSAIGAQVVPAARRVCVTVIVCACLPTCVCQLRWTRRGSRSISGK